MMLKKRRIFLLGAFLIIAALAVALWVGFFTGDKKSEYDGTLVEVSMMKSYSLYKAIK